MCLYQQNHKHELIQTEVKKSMLVLHFSLIRLINVQCKTIRTCLKTVENIQSTEILDNLIFRIKTIIFISTIQDYLLIILQVHMLPKLFTRFCALDNLIS